MPLPYVALLRGINVGGRNIISMADLRVAFEADGYGDVRTYIQSGNVVFTTDAPVVRLEAALESMLARRVGTAVMVVAVGLADLQRIVDEAPHGFGSQPDAHKCDVMFLKGPLEAARVLEVVDPREGVDEIWPGDGVVYFQRDAHQLAKSRMSRITGKPEYQLMTIRNWRTTTRLLDMVGAAG